MAIVCFLSMNGFGPAVMLGQIVQNLLILFPNRKCILKTPSIERHDFIKKNYCHHLCYDPNYKVTKKDIVIHIIDPRNIPTSGRDIFIDNLGDYWNYLFKHNLFQERLNLFKKGIRESDFCFLSSLTKNKTPWGDKYNKFLFVDNYITKIKKTNGSGLAIIGSYKTKNAIWDKENILQSQLVFSKSRKHFSQIIAKNEIIVTHPGLCSLSESMYLNKPYIYIHPANLEQALNTQIITKYNLGLVIQDQALSNINGLKLEYGLKKDSIIKSMLSFKKQRHIYNNKKLFDFLRGALYDL
ncbi:MAG: glycosyltransferase [Candidatus ainarchaeum sp.]|nr:glycosyltransferase [Candidatus ainarchaeum sp.]